MEARYELSCDNCGNAFWSKDGFLKRHLCRRCLIVFKAGQDSRLKEVKEWIETNYYIDEHGCRRIPEEFWQAFVKGLEGDQK